MPVILHSSRTRIFSATPFCIFWATGRDEITAEACCNAFAIILPDLLLGMETAQRPCRSPDERSDIRGRFPHIASLIRATMRFGVLPDYGAFRGSELHVSRCSACVVISTILAPKEFGSIGATSCGHPSKVSSSSKRVFSSDAKIHDFLSRGIGALCLALLVVGYNLLRSRPFPFDHGRWIRHALDEL